jgi:hypothetical protein
MDHVRDRVRGRLRTYCWEPSIAGQRCGLSTMSATTLWGANTRSGLQATRCYLRRRRGVSALSLDGSRYLGLATLSGLEVCWGHALRGPRRAQTYRLQASPSDLTGPQLNSQLGGTVLQIGETARLFFPFESQSSSHNMWTEITQFIFGQPLPTAEILQLLERVSFTPASRPIRQLEGSSLRCHNRTLTANEVVRAK